MSGPHRFRQIPYLVIIVTIFVTIFLTTIAISQQSRQTRSIWDLPAVVRSKPFQRWWWAYKQRVYPGDEIPQMARERAIKQIEEIRVSERTMARTSIVQGDSWISIGPAPILGGQIGDMGNTRAMSGRVADVAVDPGNQNHWLIGGAQGGIWETLDSGLTWRPKTDNQNSMAFGAIAFAPSDPMVIYAGMGEAIFGSDSYGGYGLLKSINGGESWNLIGESSFKGIGFSDIKINPANPDIVVVAVTQAFFGRGTGTDPNRTLPGLYKTANGGVTWARVFNLNQTDATDLEVDPRNFNNQYAAISDIFGSNSLNGVYRSADAGTTWTRINAPWNTNIAQVGRIELAISPSNPNVIYSSIQRTETTDWLGIWRTDNAWDTGPQGVTWTSISLHPSMLPAAGFEAQLDFDHELIVDPIDPNTLYAGGVYLWKCKPCNSTVGNVVWTEISHALNDPGNGILSNPPGGIHVDQHSMAWVNRSQAAKSISQRSMIFEPNVGQSDKQVAFLARGQGYGLFLTSNEAVISLRSQETESAKSMPAILRMNLIGSNPAASITGLEKTSNYSNYFIGRDQKKWMTDVPNYSRVQYKDAWQGVDLVYYGNQKQLEYDFVLSPGAKPSSIRLGFNGVKGMHVTKAGDLALRTGDGIVRMLKPAIYQMVDGERKKVGGRYIRRGWREIGFRTDSYDRSQPLIIDPILAYSTYFGGSGEDIGGGIVVDSGGHAYVTGLTESTNFPLQSPAFSTYKGSKDIFILKLKPSGDAPVYSTYFGGSNEEDSPSIAIDKEGSVYVTGQTESPDLPVSANAFDKKCGVDGTCEYSMNLESDVFVLKLNPSGNGLVYSTYIGGIENDITYKIIVDDLGNAYIAGQTSSTDKLDTPEFEGFPTTPGAYKTRPCATNSCSYDAFVVKLNPTGSALVFSTLLGGNKDESASGIALDKTGNIYVTGSTSSPDFPTTPGAYDRTCGTDGKCNVPENPPLILLTDDAYVTKLNSTGTSLIYSTFIGGKEWDSIGLQEIAVDDQGNAYIAGTTASMDFPTTPGCFQAVPGVMADAYAVKLNPQGSALVYSTFIGGNGVDFGTTVTLDAIGNIYVAGLTASTNFPVSNPIQSAYGGGKTDAFVAKLNSDGTLLPYSTYLGGTGDDVAISVALDGSGAAYIVGSTGSADFPIVAGAFQPTYKGLYDSFIAKITEGGGWQLVVGNDGGVWSTSDGGANWLDHNTNLALTQFYDGSLHPLKPNFALGGSQDNGTEKWTGSNGWNWIGSGDGAANTFSSSKPDTHWMISSQYLGITRTTDGGASFKAADSGIDKNNAPFIARCEKCPSNDNIFAAGGRVIWKSTNFFGSGNPSWTANSPNMGHEISAIAFGPQDSSCGHTRSGLKKGYCESRPTEGRTGGIWIRKMQSPDDKSPTSPSIRRMQTCSMSHSRDSTTTLHRAPGTSSKRPQLCRPILNGRISAREQTSRITPLRWILSFRTSFTLGQTSVSGEARAAGLPGNTWDRNRECPMSPSSTCRSTRLQTG
ncbi:MAG: SBBP repeat-containing protein [Acidobacteria bacterium]|nr:SBBP repeat-containing protein [Acidobacteriota bacterium]